MPVLALGLIDYVKFVVLIVIVVALYVVLGGVALPQVLMVAVRWLHVIFGVLWIGLLWYFNIVQIPAMPKIPDEHKPAIGKVIAPTALFWFRWAAAFTILAGLILGHLNGYLASALSFGLSAGAFDFNPFSVAMWFGIIMAYNVWFIIWPNQKKALGLVTVDAPAKAAAARTAMLFSRTNTMLSIPMLFGMIWMQNQI